MYSSNEDGVNPLSASSKVCRTRELNQLGVLFLAACWRLWTAKISDRYRLSMGCWDNPEKGGSASLPIYICVCVFNN